MVFESSKYKMKSKFNNKKKGKYKSKLEARVAKGAKGATYESAKLIYRLPNPEHKYSPDFTFLKSDGQPMYIEVKGYFRYEDQAKMKAVKECNPEADIRFVFGNKGKLPRRKMTNAEWAEKHGFKYAFAEIPKEWLHE